LWTKLQEILFFKNIKIILRAIWVWWIMVLLFFKKIKIILRTIRVWWMMVLRVKLRHHFKWTHHHWSQSYLWGKTNLRKVAP
jgi:hypothetical protein